MNARERTTANPLLDFSGLPRFDLITPEDVTPAIDTLLASARASIDAIATLDENPDWDNFVVPLADAVDPLGRAWGQVGHLNAVVNTPALRDAHNDNLPKITEFHTDFGQNERLFARYRALGSGKRRTRRSTKRSASSSTTPCATSGCPGPSCRRTRRRDSKSSTRSWQRCRRAMKTTCSTRPTRGNCTWRTPRHSRGCRRTCSPRPARKPPPTASPAGSCRCACRAICR